jgi:hypothetical protein
MADTPRSNAKKTTKRSSKPMSKRTTPAVADQSGQDQESAESAGDVETTMHAGAPGARRNEQILLLSLAITCALIGFALHLFWIIAIVLMALLWGYMASELGRSRSGGVISSAVTAIATETRQLTKEVGVARVDSGKSTHTTTSVERTEHGDREPEIHEDVIDQPEPTKKDLYEEAREAGIEGRSNMTKEELKQALEE